MSLLDSEINEWICNNIKDKLINKILMIMVIISIKIMNK